MNAILEVIFIEFVGGILIRINNWILKLRGIEVKTVEEIKLERKRKRYEFKAVKLKRDIDSIKKGTKGIVLEVIDLDFCFIEFEGIDDETNEVKLKDLLICKR